MKIKLTEEQFRRIIVKEQRPPRPDDPDKPNWVIHQPAKPTTSPLESGITRLTEKNWDQMVVNYKKPVLIMFTAEWCPHCKKFYSSLNELSPDSNFRVGIVDMTKEKSETPLAKKYGVRGIPRMKVFKNGKLKDVDLDSIRMAQMLGKDVTNYIVKELRKEIDKA